MITSHSLRLYANPIRLLLYLLVFGAITLGGVWLLRTSGGDPLLVVVGWIFIVFFGLGTAIFLAQFVRDVVLRRPILQIDEQGWSSRPSLVQGKRSASWQDIEDLGVYRQWAGQRGILRSTRYAYYLVVHGRRTEIASHGRLDALSIRFYPLLQESMMAVPLNTLFLRTTPEKVEQVLRYILHTYSHEIQVRRIQASTEVRDL